MKKKIVSIVIIAAFLLAIIVVIRSDDSARITQYEDMSGAQGMFYTIQTPDHKLIVVDSGNPENAEYVREVLAELGNHVDLWILTHPHPDHIGAFNIIWADPGGLTVDAVCTIEMDYDHYRTMALDVDGFAYYEEFLRITQGDPRVRYAHTGDSWECGGLKFEVLHAYSAKEYRQYSFSYDLPNAAGMMFKVTNHKESMLFCADVQNVMSGIILEQCGDRLPSDYVQMSHHGNGGLSEEVYAAVHPKTAFFDAPDWLMNPQEGSDYNTPETRELMESMGATVYDYTTAPNVIELK